MTNQKTLLLLGGGYAEIPLIKAAKALGYYVITTGNRESDLGHAYSDKYIKADFSNKEEMLSLTKELKVDAICPCANDFSALSCAYVAEHLGFSGYDSYEVCQLIHHKDRYRNFAMENNISSPKASSFDNIESAIKTTKQFNLPVIVKPIDLSGGKGVSIIHSSSEAAEAIKRAFVISRAKKIVIEEFIEGTNHGLSTFIRDGKVVFHFCDNEHYFLNKYMVSGASTPGNAPVKVINTLLGEIEKISSILKLTDGIFHIQFILKDNIPYIIEICRRPPGDLYVKFVQHATGIDYPSYIVKAFSGMEIDDMTQVDPNGFYTRHCVMADKIGKVKDIHFDESIKKNVIDMLMWWSAGDVITDIMTQKFGIVFLQYDTFDEMLTKVEKLNKLIKVEVM